MLYPIPNSTHEGSPLWSLCVLAFSGRLLAYFFFQAYLSVSNAFYPQSLLFLMRERPLLFWSVHIGSSLLRLDYIEVCSGATVCLVFSL